MTESAAIRVLIADDHPLARAGVAAMLETQPDIDVVAAAEDGAAAVRLALETQPHVLVVDLRMPALDGVAVTRAVLAQPSPPKVVVLSHYDGDDDVWNALKAGAHGYLTKTCRGEALADAIRTVHRGERYLPAELSMRMATRVGQNELTFRERQVLDAVFAGQTNKQIAKDLSITERTIALHVSNILGKLGARTRTEAVAIALSRGLLKPPASR